MIDKNYDLSRGSNWLTTTTVAKLLNLSVGTIHKLVDKGTLSAWKTQGGHRRIMRASLEEYVLKSRAATLLEKTNTKTHFVLGSADEAFLLQLKKILINRTNQCEYFDYASLERVIVAIYSRRPDAVVLDIDLFQEDTVVRWLRSLREDHLGVGNMKIFLACSDLQNLTAEIRAIGLTHQIKLVSKNAYWLEGYFESMVDRSGQV